MITSVQAGEHRLSRVFMSIGHTIRNNVWRTVIGRETAGNENNPASSCLQRFYDVCVVRSSEAQESSFDSSNYRKLAYRFFRVLFPGSCEPVRTWGIHRRPIENDTGSHYAHRFHRFFGALSQGRDQMELHCRISLSYRRRIFRI